MGNEETTGSMGEGLTSWNGSRKRFLGAAGLAGLGALGVAGCGGGSSSSSVAVTNAAGKAAGGESKSVIWALAALDPWNVPIDVGFIEATNMLGWSYQKVGVPIAQYSAENVVNVVNRAIQAKPDVLVTPPWVQGVAKSAERAIEEGILVIFNNADNIPQQTEELEIAYVGANDYDSGKTLAPVLYDAARAQGKEDGTVIGGLSFPGNENLENRLRGVSDGFEELNRANGTSFEFERFIDGGPDIGAARTAYAAKIRELGLDNVAAVVTNMEVPAIIGALREADANPGEVPVGSWNLYESTVTGIEEGWVTASMDVQDYSTGFLPVMLAWMYFEAGQQPKSYDSGSVAITKAEIKKVGKREEELRAKGKEFGVRVS